MYVCIMCVCVSVCLKDGRKFTSTFYGVTNRKYLSKEQIGYLLYRCYFANACHKKKSQYSTFDISSKIGPKKETAEIYRKL